ncbi:MULTISPECIES: class I adenylate-forming enzyme family protein [Arthrobacter]|uniref:Long-chain fatty acid--CoA ligase n=1 Tax=Arthrobacter terricola TaxID=2547396 RepID=A0A4R5L1A2_9MICC|nr:MULTISPECIES: fatty acid--CoA ligase family protein [Arthrobacter]MBT8159584.1 fatty acid--CoA ligase family protein [Arthrobacter sp. GN70]TDG01296.1 long-chain fatty acid--CoA ligase [Arthrobacter terricola]
MNISVLLSIVAETVPDRAAVRDATTELSYEGLNRASSVLGAQLKAAGYGNVSMVDTNSVVFPLLFFAAAKAGIPFVPLNYRLADEQLRRQVERLENTLVVTDSVGAARLEGLNNPTIRLRAEILESALEPAGDVVVDSDDDQAGTAACWLFTSGTTGEPKIVVLKHDSLASYVLGTVDAVSADEMEAVLVSVPPYHIAGLASVLTSMFAGRRMVYLDSFEAGSWVAAVVREGVTQAMVVPTMLQRILSVLSDEGETLPQLRNLSYGGGRMPIELIESALAQLPHVGFTNAYGLTETSSTITLLGPDDHRVALESEDPAVRARLGSVGRPIPGLELQVRDADGMPVGSRVQGEIWVRGPQVSGEYKGNGSQLLDGWFCTRDEGWLDEEGYLFLLGRVDDVIVRGGENISPGEIEDVLRTDPGVADVAVVAEPDETWGEVPVAVIVASEGAAIDREALKALVRSKLRSSRVPASIVEVEQLPYNETGKLLRLSVRDLLRAHTS